MASFPQFVAFLATSVFLIFRLTWPLWATALGAHGSRESNSGQQKRGAAAASREGGGLPPLSDVRKGAEQAGEGAAAATPEAAKTVGRKLMQEQARAEGEAPRNAGFEWRVRSPGRFSVFLLPPAACLHRSPPAPAVTSA